MAIQLEMGLDIIRSYKRLDYTPWHALAEFVDNSTQSYFNNRATLDECFRNSDERLDVSIVYDRDTDTIRISDNSIGMTYEELAYALRVGARPAITSGRSKYGLGLKTAACWLGNSWSVRTKKLGSTEEHYVEVDVEAVANGKNDLPYLPRAVEDTNLHYTVIEIRDLNQRFHGRTVGRIKDYLRSMYRQDIRDGSLVLRWQDTELRWEDMDDQLLRARDGTRFKKGFDFAVEGKRVHGWVGVLDRGGRAKAGFSILHSGRVVKGWPDSWRPESIYGQIQGSNDLVNQRLVGEVHLDDFEVTHTKDDILWLGAEDEVQEELKKVCADYREVARHRRKGDDDERGPSELEIKAAVDELQQELTSAELADLISIETIPPPEIVDQALRPLLESVGPREVAFGGPVGSIEVLGYLVGDASPNDPYVVVEPSATDRVIVVVNLSHPYVKQLSGSEGVLDYLRHCTYDAIAEWQALHKASTIDPDTIKLLKDKLLRLPSSIEMHAREAGGTAVGAREIEE